MEFHQRISKHYGRLDRLNEVVASKLKDPDIWRFESRVAEKVVEDWLNEHPSITTINASTCTNQEKLGGVIANTCVL